MKSTYSERGSAHLVLIIVLVIAVLGLLGFVFWQNFANQPAEQSETNQSVTNESTNEDAPDPAASFDTPLAVDEWGVVGDVGNIGAVSYAISNSEGTSGSLVLSVEGLDCGQSANGPGSILRLSATQLYPSAFESSTAEEVYTSSSEGSTQIGDYYYFYIAPNAVCVDENGADRTEDAEELAAAGRLFVETLVEKE